MPSLHLLSHSIWIRKGDERIHSYRHNFGTLLEKLMKMPLCSHGTPTHTRNGAMAKCALLGLGIALSVATGAAHAETFYFVTTGTAYVQFNPLPDPMTITGEILGLNNNDVKQPASSVVVTSISDRSELALGIPYPPIGFSSNLFNTFSVTNNKITFADFQSTPNYAGVDGFDLGTSAGNPASFLLYNTISWQLQNNVNLFFQSNSTTFSTTPVPELPAPLLLSAGLLTPLLARWRRKQLAV